MQCLNKKDKKMNRWEFFNSVFSYGKLRDSSLTYIPFFVMLYLKIVVENIDQMHKNTFFLTRSVK